MANKQKKTGSLKRNLIEWGIIAAIFAILYFTGLHTEVIGRIQQVLLQTGIMQPEMSIDTSQSIPADYSFVLEDSSGERVSLNRFKGKVVFMNFWATWCPPCIAEMPNIQSLYNKIDREDIVFLMVSLDESHKRAHEFMERKGFSFPYYFPASPVPEAYRSPSIPTTFVISPKGEIVVRREGMAEYDTPAFRQFLRELTSKSTGHNAISRPVNLP